MFYLLESPNQLKWLENQIHLPLFVDVIPSNDLYHSKLTTTTAVYVRILGQSYGYIIPLDHYEGINVEKQRVYNILLKADKVYTLNKKNLLYHFNLQRVQDISLMYSMTFYKKLEYSTSNSTIDWYYRNYQDRININCIIPITKLYERAEYIFSQVESTVNLNLPPGFNFYNNTATNVFFLLEQNGVGIIYDEFNKAHTPKNPLFNTLNNTVFTEYNLYNNTSRPTNTFNSVNFAAIPKTVEHRQCFKPQNDYFVEFDFDGYHLRLLADQIQYSLTQESAHKQLAIQYFDKQDITDDEYSRAKQINFHAIYGKIPEEYKNLKIFKQIQKYIDNLWEQFQYNGEVYNPQSGKAFSRNLQDMNPAKLMNYMMQSLETSNNITILKEVLKYLRDKKSFITLYVYDAIVFDFSKEDGKQTLEDIKNIMEKQGKYPTKFKYSSNLVL